MKISTKGSYALEVIVDLAMHSGDGQAESIKTIAARRKLSEKYLERIVSMLRKADIVTSIRGAHGGYKLSRPPEKILIKEVLAAAEGDLAPVECLTKKTDCGINCEKCPTRGIWNQIWEEIKQVVGNTTVDDLIKKADEYKEL